MMGSPAFDALGFARKIVVGVGGLAASNDRSVTLSTYSLGSCLGIAAYDPVAKAAGLLHAMLPDSSINQERAESSPGVFIDTGIPSLLRALYQLRAEKHRIRFCVAGGAQMMDPNQFFNIGERNTEALRELLRAQQFRVAASDIGGVISRTMHLSVQNGEVRLRTPEDSQDTILLRASAAAQA